MSSSSKRAIGQVTVRGDVAWLVSTSTTTGESGGRAGNSQGAELVVLVRTPPGWEIAALPRAPLARPRAGAERAGDRHSLALSGRDAVARASQAPRGARAREPGAHL